MLIFKAMKRLKIILLFVILIFSLSFLALANEVKKRSFFDSTFQSAIDHFNNSMNEFSTNFDAMSLGQFKTEWDQGKEGRTLYIQTQSKDQKLDIKIENQMLEIKTAEEKRTENMQSISQSSQIISVPYDCDGNKAKISQTDDGIKVFFPFTESVQQRQLKKSPKKGIESERIPLKPIKGEVDV